MLVFAVDLGIQRFNRSTVALTNRSELANTADAALDQNLP